MSDRAKRNTFLTLFIALHLVVIFPGFFSTQGYAEQNRDLPFSPPTRLRFVRPDGHFSLRPFVYGWNQSALDTGNYEVDRSQIYPLHFFLGGSPYTIVKGLNASTHLLGVDKPGRLFLFGTARVGEFLEKGFTFISIGNDLHHVLTQAGAYVADMENIAKEKGKSWKRRSTALF